MQRLLATTLTLSVLHLFGAVSLCLVIPVYPACAAEELNDSVGLPALNLEDGVTVNLEENEETVQELAAARAPEAVEVYKSAVKYDTANHQWVDKYRGRQVDIAIPASLGELNMEQVVEDGSTPEQQLNSIGGTFPFKRFLVGSILSIGMGNPFAVPLALSATILQQQRLHQRANSRKKAKQSKKEAVYDLLQSNALLMPSAVQGPNPFILPGSSSSTYSQTTPVSGSGNGSANGNGSVENIGILRQLTELD